MLNEIETQFMYKHSFYSLAFLIDISIMLCYPYFINILVHNKFK